MSLKLIAESPQLLLSHGSESLVDDIYSAGYLTTALKTLRAIVANYEMLKEAIRTGIIIDLLTVDVSDLILSANTTITVNGVAYYKKIDTNGYNLTVDGQPAYIVAREVIVRSGSNMLKTPTGGAGGAPGASPGRGGNGGGGLFIIAKRVINLGAIAADGERGESGSTTDVTASGQNGGPGHMIALDSADKPGDGGAGGNSGIYAGAGGGGGLTGGAGGIIAGKGGSITVEVVDIETFLKLLFHYLVNNKLGLTTVVPFNPYGAGGGGGGDDDYDADSGGGGGSGGELIIVASEVVNEGIISARGGNGGDGGVEGDSDAGGGGGGGGLVYIIASTVKQGTINVSGGAGGTGDYNGSPGSAGTYRVIKL